MDVTCTRKYRTCRTLCLAQNAELRLHKNPGCSFIARMEKDGACFQAVYMSTAGRAGCVVVRESRYCAYLAAPVESAMYCFSDYMSTLVVTHWPRACASHWDFFSGDRQHMLDVLTGKIGRLCVPNARTRAWAIASTASRSRVRKTNIAYLRSITVAPCVDAACRAVSLELASKHSQPGFEKAFYAVYNKAANKPVFYTNMHRHEEIVGAIRQRIQRKKQSCDRNRFPVES